MQPITAVFSVPESNSNLGAVLAQLKNNAREAHGGRLRQHGHDEAGFRQIPGARQPDRHEHGVGEGAGHGFNNDDLALFPNQFVNAHLLVRTLKDATLIPTATIQQNGQTSFVYVIKDGTAHIQNIKPGVVDDKLGLTQVEGVNPGDVIANSSFDKLQDNSKVTIQSPTPAGGEKGKGHGGKGGNSPAPHANASPAADAGASPSPGTSASPAHHKHSADSGS